MKAWLVKAVLPVVFVAGGIGAWATTWGSSAVGEARAWIDAPIAGATFAPGLVEVQAHASAPGGVDEIELLVDAKPTISTKAAGDDTLALATLAWEADIGTHQLQVRARAGGRWSGVSDTVSVTVGSPDDANQTDDPEATSPDGSAPSSTSPGSSTAAPSSTTSRPTSETTTSSAGPTSIAGQATTIAGHSTTSSPGSPPLVPPGISSNPDTWAMKGDPVRLTALGQAPGMFTLTIEVRSGRSGPFTPVASCTVQAGDPCRTEYGFPTIGVAQFRAVISTSDGRRAVSTVGELTIRGNDS